MWFSLRDSILRCLEELAVSTLQLLRALLSLRCTLQLHVMYETAADQCETGTEDHANVWQIRVSCTSSDNTKYVDLSLKLSADRMATTLHSNDSPDVTFITYPSRMFWHYHGQPKSRLAVSNWRRRGRCSDTAC